VLKSCVHVCTRCFHGHVSVWSWANQLFPFPRFSFSIYLMLSFDLGLCLWVWNLVLCTVVELIWVLLTSVLTALLIFVSSSSSLPRPGSLCTGQLRSKTLHWLWFWGIAEVDANLNKQKRADRVSLMSVSIIHYMWDCCFWHDGTKDLHILSLSPGVYVCLCIWLSLSFVVSLFITCLFALRLTFPPN